MNGLVLYHPEPGTPAGLTRQLVRANVSSEDPNLADAAMDHEIKNLW